VKSAVTATAAAVVLLVAPVAAGAAWLPAVDISAEGNEYGFDQYPQVAADASGGAVAVWPQLYGPHLIQAATKLLGGGWESPVDLSPPNQYSLEPQVAMNEAGEAVAAWIRLDSERKLEVASRTPQGSWGAPEEISAAGGGPNHVDVAIGPAGEAAVVWTGYQNTSDYIIRAMIRSASGQWGLPIELSKPGQNAWEPKIAFDSSGNLVAAWYRWNAKGDTIVQVAEKARSQAWGEPRALSAEGGMAGSPEIAVSGGQAVVAWERELVIEASVRGVGGAWQPAVEISGPKSAEPSLGMDGEGNAVVLWSSGAEYSLRNAEVASLPVGGNWTKPITIAEDLTGGWGQPQVAVDPAGRAMAVWTAWDGSRRIVEAASGEVEGSWGPPVAISPADSWSQRADVAMDSLGNAAAVWQGEPLTVQAAVFDATDPRFNSLSIPSQVRAGRPALFAASPFDAWSLASPPTWTFGDGSGAAGSSVDHSFQSAGKFDVTVTTSDEAGHSTAASATVKVTPALAVSGRLVKVRNGKAQVRLECPGTALCHGNVLLSRHVKAKTGRRVTRVIGRTVVAIPGGAEQTVTIKLKPRSLRPRADAPGKGLPAQISGDAIEPRSVVLKRFIPRPKRTQKP